MRRYTRSFRILLVAAFMAIGASQAMAQQSGASAKDSAATSQATKDRGANQPVEDGVPESAETAQVRERVQFLLSGYEYFPTRKDLDEVASAPILTTVLKSMVSDSKLAPPTRFRAVDALGLYNEPDVAKFLLGYVAPPAKDADPADIHTLELMRHRVIIAYAKSQGALSNEALIPLLEDSDLQIRLTAISALGKHGGLEAVKHLRALKDRDTHHAVQRELNKHIR